MKTKSSLRKRKNLRKERMERRKRRRSASRGRKGGRKDDRENRLDREREKVVSEFGGEKLVVDEAERKMDNLEGAIRAEDEDVCLIYQDRQVIGKRQEHRSLPFQ